MRSCIDAYNAHDTATVAAMVTEDADIRDMAAGERFVGPAEVREFVEREWRDVASDARWELGQVLVDGEAFAAEWVTSGTKDRAGGGFPPPVSPSRSTLSRSAYCGRASSPRPGFTTT